MDCFVTDPTSTDKPQIFPGFPESCSPKEHLDVGWNSSFWDETLDNSVSVFNCSKRLFRDYLLFPGFMGRCFSPVSRTQLIGGKFIPTLGFLNPTLVFVLHSSCVFVWALPSLCSHPKFPSQAKGPRTRRSLCNDPDLNQLLFT